MLDVYITGLGKFLPGNPVSNAEIEDVIGCLGPRSSTLGKATLRKNGIRQRYYSCTPGGGFTHTNAAMAAQAVTNAAAHACRDAGSIELLATSTTQGDYLVPGFASSVHADVDLDTLRFTCSLVFGIGIASLANLRLERVDLLATRFSRMHILSDDRADPVGLRESCPDTGRWLCFTLAQHVGKAFHVRRVVVAPDAPIDLKDVTSLNHSIRVGDFSAIWQMNIDRRIPGP